MDSDDCLPHEELDNFVRNTHSGNSGRTNNKIIIDQGTVIMLQAISFELRDRDKCNSLPTADMLNALNVAQITLLRAERTLAMERAKNRRTHSLPDMDIPKLTQKNYDEFNTAFATLVSRQIGVNDIPLDYLLRDNAIGNYEAQYASREERLKQCIIGFRLRT